jgi:integrase
MQFPPPDIRFREKPSAMAGLASGKSLITLFEDFIADSEKGRRRQPGGSPLRMGSIANYRISLGKLKKYQADTGSIPLLYDLHRSSLRQVEKTRVRWSRFYRKFSDFLRTHGARSDNYLGFHFKHLKTLFHHLEKAHGWELGPVPGLFYVRKEKVPILVVSIDRIRTLLYDEALQARLTPPLQEAREIFLAGCFTGLRVSDLLTLQRSHLEKLKESTHLVVSNHKTGTLVRIPVPDFILEIFKKHLKTSNRLLPRISNSCLNKRLKALGEAAGWTEPHILWRNRNGKPRMIYKDAARKTHFRFCDLITSHTMRRSAISMMLATGMPEHLVRKISGHAPNSAEFFRYVEVSQEQLDLETRKFFAILAQKPTPT